jgi:Zn-dependent peptidase ImmA (M78 family)
MLIPVGTGAVILENDSHDPFRRRSTMAHEMAHVVLGHSFTPGVVDERGCRLSSQEDELEAAHLGGELLLPLTAAKALAFRDCTDEQAAARFQVSIEIARWRLNGTGARKLVRNARAKAARQ